MNGCIYRPQSLGFLVFLLLTGCPETMSTDADVGGEDLSVDRSNALDTIVDDAFEPNDDVSAETGIDAATLDPLLQSRLYPDWCLAGAVTAIPTNVVSTVEVGDSIQAAIDAASDGVVELAEGVHTISATIRLKSGVLLRGSSNGSTIETTQAMNSMVSLEGGYNGEQNITLTDATAFSHTLTFSGDSMTPGYWLIGSTAKGQLVRVLEVEGNVAALETALGESFDGLSVVSQNELIEKSGLQNVTLTPKHTVKDLVFVRSATDCWVDNVQMNGVGGQLRAGIFTRQVYRVSLTNNVITDAAEHGDGGQGYGIDVANNSSNCLVAGNTLRRLRHSMLLQGAAVANVFRMNDSADPLHPNFVPGGPADMSFHGYSSSNLVDSNLIDRIQIIDSGLPGVHNTIAFNTLRSGPLTLDKDVNQLTLLGNQIEGDVATLRARIMPSIATESTAGNPSPERPFWENDYDPFEGPGGSSGFTERGMGILDWGSGDDVYIDEQIRPNEVSFCN